MAEINEAVEVGAFVGNIEFFMWLFAYFIVAPYLGLVLGHFICDRPKNASWHDIWRYRYWKWGFLNG